LNIAEGSDRATDADFIRFLVIARGSVNEVAAGLDIALDNGYITDGLHKELSRSCAIIIDQLMAFMRHLRNKRSQQES